MATVLVHEIAMPNLGGESPQRAGRWPVPSGIHRPARPHGHRSRAGFSIIELMIYLAVFAVIGVLAWTSFARVFDVTNDHRRIGDRVSALARAGERWRDEVRRSTALPRLDDAAAVFRLRLAEGDVAYLFNGGRLVRTNETLARADVLVDGLTGGAFEREPAEGVVAWRMDARLQSRQRPERVLGAFRFLAVASAAKEGAR
jgi:type II secretory pathway pseudopilin PulG